MTAERTVERLPTHCLSTVCRSPHTPLRVAQHRCCARLGSLHLAGYSKQPTQRGLMPEPRRMVLRRYSRRRRSSSRFCSEACKQRAYRKRLSVTKFAAEGWELLPAVDGTHHGECSALMRRRQD